MIAAISDAGDCPLLIAPWRRPLVILAIPHTAVYELHRSAPTRFNPVEVRQQTGEKSPLRSLTLILTAEETGDSRH